MSRKKRKMMFIVSVLCVGLLVAYFWLNYSIYTLNTVVRPKRDLMNTRRSWVIDGRPDEYSVENYVMPDNGYRVMAVDTNTYRWQNDTLKGLFSLRLMNYDNPKQVLITRNGVVLSQKPSGRLVKLGQDAFPDKNEGLD